MRRGRPDRRVPARPECGPAAPNAARAPISCSSSRKTEPENPTFLGPVLRGGGGVNCGEEMRPGRPPTRELLPDA